MRILPNQELEIQPAQETQNLVQETTTKQDKAQAEQTKPDQEQKTPNSQDQGRPTGPAGDPSGNNSTISELRLSVIPISAIVCRRMNDPITTEERDALKWVDAYLEKNMAGDPGKAMFYGTLAAVFIPRLFKVAGFSLEQLLQLAGLAPMPTQSVKPKT